MNGREIDLCEPPKILGDIFESLMGAIFLDGGIEKVIEVYQHLLSPFILFTSKYSKQLCKEPKDDFNSLSNLLQIRPHFRHIDIEVDSIEAFQKELYTCSDPEHAYVMPDLQSRSRPVPVTQYQEGGATTTSS